jgi:hypothetical protein
MDRVKKSELKWMNHMTHRWVSEPHKFFLFQLGCYKYIISLHEDRVSNKQYSHMAHLCFSLYWDLFSWDTPVTPKGAKALTSIRTKLSNICISSTTCSWRIAQYVVVEWLAHLLRNWEESGSNLGPESGYPEWGLYGFPQSLQANAGMVP